MAGKNAALGALTLIVLGCAPAPEPPEALKPNIVVILADDLSFRDLSIYGQTRFETPHLDRLAARGLRFTQAYAGAPECAPSRGTLLTGLHAGHAPIRINSSARGQDHLPDDAVTFAEMLREAGYATGMVGKWGVGLPGTPGTPDKQGFDYSYGFYDQSRAHTFYPHYVYENGEKIPLPQNYGFDMERLYRYNAALEPAPEDMNRYDDSGAYLPAGVPDPAKAVNSETLVEQRALELVRDNRDRPFLLYFATQLPHGPLVTDNLAPFHTREDYPSLKNKEWAAMVVRLDTFVGRLVEELKRLGVWKNTVLFFASDNGYAMCGYMGRGNAPANWPDDPFFQNKGPFRGGKFSAMEGGTRVPFFAHWEGRIEPGVSNTPVWLVDLFPTFADLAGQPTERELDGVSLKPLLLDGGEIPEDRPLYWYKNDEQAVRMGPWKAYRPHPDEPLELYLIEEDQHGDRNLAALYPDVVAQVEAVMESEHEPHEWYRNPGESAADFEAKKRRAAELGQLQKSTRANTTR